VSVKTRVNHSVDKALTAIIQIAEEPGEWSTSQLARNLGLSKSAVHYILGTLKQRGFLRQDEISHKWRLSTMFVALGQKVKGRLGIREIAYPYMKQLVDMTGEAAYLLVPRGREAVLLERVEPQSGIQVTMRLGESAPLYAGAGHKIILAFMSDDELFEMLGRGPLPKVGPSSPETFEALAVQIESARRLGYLYTEDEYIEGIAGVAAPIRDDSGHALASLTIAGFKHRLGPRKEELADAVLRMSKAVEKALAIRVKE